MSYDLLKIRGLSLVENLFKKNPLQDLLSSLNAVILSNQSTQIISGHVIYKPAYTYKFQLKTTKVNSKAKVSCATLKSIELILFLKDK